MSLINRWERLLRSDSELEADRLADRAMSECGELVKNARAGDFVALSGRLQAVTLRPSQVVPAVEADFYDGSGHVRLVWLGRRSIGGIEVGRRLIVSGRLTGDERSRTIFNPRYTLLPGHVE